MGAIPTDIVVHENPLGFKEQKYTIKFFSHTNKAVTIGPAGLEEIVSCLQDKALVFASRGGAEALAIIIGAFAKDKKIIINNDLETPGFYFISDKIRAYHVDHPKPTQQEKGKMRSNAV